MQAKFIPQPYFLFLKDIFNQRNHRKKEIFVILSFKDSYKIL